MRKSARNSAQLRGQLRNHNGTQRAKWRACNWHHECNRIAAMLATDAHDATSPTLSGPETVVANPDKTLAGMDQGVSPLDTLSAPPVDTGLALTALGQGHNEAPRRRP